MGFNGGGGWAGRGGFSGPVSRALVSRAAGVTGELAPTTGYQPTEGRTADGTAPATRAGKSDTVSPRSERVERHDIEQHSGH